MRRTLARAACVIGALVGASSAHAQGLCNPEQSSDCEIDQDTYVLPDKPVAFGASLEGVLRDVDSELFLKDRLGTRLGTFLALDVHHFDGPSGLPVALALELDYRLEQASSTELFGGTVSTSLTSHELGVGPHVRLLSDGTQAPPVHVYSRFIGGLQFGPLALRDARGGGHYDVSASAFFDLGVGIELRAAGVFFEVGYELAWPRELELSEAATPIRLERQGVYVRTGLSMRVP